MMEFLAYDLKVAVLVAVFYMFYRLLLSHETYHRVNRLVLLSTAVASFVLPLCVITIHETVMVSRSGEQTADIGPLTAVIETQVPLWQTLAVGVFLTGAVITLGRQLIGLTRVCWLIAHSELHPQADGATIAVSEEPLSPFSWMHYIILSRSDYEAQDAAVLAHERGHIRQHHTLDVILVDTLTALQWFNPAMWMLRQDLRAIHEYEADAAVLSQGINMRQYQYLLIQKAVGHCGYSVANGITHSTLKNRINMMLHKKSNRASRLKLLALVPIVGTVVALQARTVTDYVYAQPQKKVVVKKGRKAGQVKLSGQTIELKTDTATLKGENVNVELDMDHQKEPLIIINGKKSTKAEMEALAPEAIDHIDVLKNEASTAQFGEEGKNGVIMITTKTESQSELGEVQVITYDTDSKDDKADDKRFPKVFDVVEQMPEFPGGVEALMKFLSENVRYPEAALETGAQGRVLVNFIVETDGRISNVRVVKKANDDLDAEAIRLIGSMPKWKPGMQNGEAVRVMYTLPVTFRLS